MKPERRKRQIEREFGVPVAGEILDPSLWTNTALKKLPAGQLDLPALFGRTAPLVVDIGCGNGRFLIGSAVWRSRKRWTLAAWTGLPLLSDRRRRKCA